MTPEQMDLKKNPAGCKLAGKILKRGGVGVTPTDTIYGIVGKALDKKTVARIYKLRKRSLKKPFIILISTLDDLATFNIKLDKAAKKILNKVWPGKVSVILSCKSKKFFYLHRGTKTLAFRLPGDKNLTRLLKKTGPLVAPSANLEGKKPASTAAEAKKYFGKRADFYLGGGKKKAMVSTLIKIDGNRPAILRQGAGRINLK